MPPVDDANLSVVKTTTDALLAAELLTAVTSNLVEDVAARTDDDVASPHVSAEEATGRLLSFTSTVKPTEKPQVLTPDEETAVGAHATQAISTPDSILDAARIQINIEQPGSSSHAVILPATSDCVSTVSSSVDEEDDADTIELNRLRALNDHLESEFSVAKREHEAAMAKLRLQLAAVTKEKDDTVMKFAVKETQILDAQKSRDAADRKSRDAAAESEKARKLVAKMKEERDRACADADKRTKDMQQAKREADQLRSDVKARDGRIKWLQDRLKYEMEEHQQCKSSLDSTTTMLADRVKHLNKIEGIFSHVSSMLHLDNLSVSPASPVKAVDAVSNASPSSDHIPAPLAVTNSPDDSLRVAAAVEQHIQALTEKQHILEQRCSDESRLSADIEQHRRLLSEKTQEVDMLQANLECMRAEMRITHSNITQLNDTLRMQQSEIETLQNVRHRKVQLDAELHAAQQTVLRLQGELDDSRQELMDYKADTQRTSERNRELMEYTEKLTARLVGQQASETQHKTDAVHAANALQILEMAHDSLKAQYSDLQQRYDANITSVEQRCTTLQSQYEEMQQKATALEAELDELKNQHRIAVRNHTAIVRDLKHQLAQFTRNESSLLKAKNFDTLSVHSAHDDSRAHNGNGASGVRKTFSNNSLSQSGTVDRNSPVFARRSSLAAENNENTSVQAHAKKSSLPASPEKFSNPVAADEAQPPKNNVPIEQADRQLLIERIVRLQRRLAKRNERIDAFNEQLRIAYEDLRKKTSIIERFVMNCDAEQLIANYSSPGHAAEAKSLRQSVMESIFSAAGGISSTSASSAGSPPTALTMEINKKLQAVLEDTLFKNITLKENLQTLGEEICKISRDNEQLRSRLK